jgi:hypothetical protein
MHGMWVGIAVIVVVVASIALGQWYVTRPTTRGVVDTRRGRAEIEAKYGEGNDIIRGELLP